MILEGFEKFTQAGGSFKPKISIRSNGQIGLSKGAVKRFEIDKFDFVTLYYNKEQERIAIVMSNNGEEDGAIRIVKREGNYFFSGKSFLEYNDISYEATKSFDVEWDSENKVAIIDLGSDKYSDTESE